MSLAAAPVLPTPEDVEAARARLRGVAVRTPLLKLSAEIPGVNIYLKLENLQPWGSFKIRPAFNVLKSMDPQRLQGGVLTASAGNFGQGLAFAARQIGVPITVVVPEGSAATKAQALSELGAKVIRVPFDEWWTALTARAFPGEEGVFVNTVAESAVIVNGRFRTSTPSYLTLLTVTSVLGFAALEVACTGLMVMLGSWNRDQITM